MKAVILAAGRGKRMYPFTDIRPKVMLPVANKPIAEHLLVEMKKAGVKEVLFVVGYAAEKIRDYFGTGSRWGISVEYATQKDQLGTADAVRHVAGWIDRNFILANGDVICQSEDIRFVMGSQTLMISLWPQANVSGLGVVETEGSRVVRIHEKTQNPPCNLVNAGLYLLTPEIFPAIEQTPLSSRGEYELTDSLQLLVDQGTYVAAYTLRYWMNFTHPWDLLQVNEVLLQS